MTLRRQIILIISALFLLLFAGTFSIDVHNTRVYLNEQLTTISQDMATNMGLTLSPYLSENDTAIIEANVNAAFDSGYYDEIIIVDVDGKTILQRKSDRPIEDVPAWFIRMFPLETPVGETMLMNGWSQFGSLRVSAHPESAYIKMWSSFKQSLILFIVCFAVLFAVMLTLLHFILLPLKAVVEQAKAISNKDYAIQERIPRTKELNEVVLAMNMMSSKIKDIFNRQEALLERTQEAAYTDEATGLPNRTAFNAKLRQILEYETGLSTGILAFIEVCRLVEINNTKGFMAGNHFLSAVANILKQAIVPFSNQDTIVARMTGTTFAIAISTISAEQAKVWTEKLLNELKTLPEKEHTPYNEVAHVGITLAKGLSFSELLSQTDIALRTAQLQGNNTYYIHEQTSQSEFSSLTATQWSTLLQTVIREKRFTLFKQKVVDAKDLNRTLHQEIFIRITNESQQIIPANIFMPMIHHYGMTQELDRMIVNGVIDELVRNTDPTLIVAVNLTGKSLENHDFVTWLYNKLKALPNISKRLRFEFTDFAALKHLNAGRAFKEKLAPLGVKIGIDHFGRNITSINNLRPHYIKIDGSFIQNIESNRDNRHFVDLLISSAHANDILVMAESVETQQTCNIVSEMGVDAIQGYGIEKPIEWINNIDN